MAEEFSVEKGFDKAKIALKQEFLMRPHEVFEDVSNQSKM